MSAGAGDQIAREFDAKAATYEESRLAPWYQAQDRAVLDEIPADAEGVLLDIGCGSGWLLRRAIATNPRLRGVGIDLSPRMIETARSKAPADDSIRFVAGDWERDAFELPPIRYAVCVSAMHYFEDPESALRRIHAALEPGGAMVLLDRAKEGSWITRCWDLLHRLVIRDRCRFYSTEELLDLLVRAGFPAPRLRSRIEKWFWHGKLHTSLALLRATRSD